MGTRDRILDAATRVIHELGLARATTKEIARAAGYSEATLYKHFQDKEELFLSVIIERVPPLSATISELPARVGRGSVRQNLEQVATAALDFYAAAFPLAVSLFSESRLFNAYRDKLASQGTGPHTPVLALARYIEAERDLGRLPPDTDPPAVAALLMGACFHRAFLSRFAAEPPITEGDRRPAEAIVAALLVRAGEAGGGN